MSREDFLEKIRSKPPSDFLVEWLSKTGLTGGIALDIGCGAGADAEYLAKAGFMVDAIDISPIAVKNAKKRCENLKVDVLLGDFREFAYRSDYYSLIYAHNALPFVPKDDLISLITVFRNSLKSGGYVMLTVFGPEHAWFGREDMNFWEKDDFVALWKEFEIVHVDERKGAQALISGEQIFQHRIHFIAKKP